MEEQMYTPRYAPNIQDIDAANPMVYDQMKRRILGDSDASRHHIYSSARNILAKKTHTHWLATLLIIGFIIDYVILWTRLPMLYSLLLIGSLPLTGAYIWSVHSLYNSPATRTLGLVVGICSLIYSVIMSIAISKIPKQKCEAV
jgi:hypothetical protein